MRTILTHMVALLALPGVASAQLDGAQLDGAGAGDAGVEDAAIGCGDLTYQGECAGDLLRYCGEDGQLKEVDCLVYDGLCGLVDCVTEDCVGYACVAHAGTSCAELWCDIEQGHGCRAGLCQPSDTCDKEGFASTCDGDLLSFCPTGRVWDVDCGENGTYPATCGEASDGEVACLRLLGAQCDPEQGVECFGVLVCSAGFCVDPADADAGPLDVEGNGDGGGADAGNGHGNGVCDCRQGSTGAGLFWLLAFIAGLWRRHSNSVMMAP